jgi:hypothetical protein
LSDFFTNSSGHPAGNSDYLVDPLFNELQIGIKNSDESSVRETYLQALRGCLEPAGNKMSPPVRRQLLQHLLAYESHPEDVTRFQRQFFN